MTHSELIDFAAAWLRKKCAVVITDMTSFNSETPDAIGWEGCAGRCSLIECKASRSDFLADRRKSFRRFPEYGMGSLRYFLCPEGVIKTEDLPPCWGLLVIRAGRVFQIKKPTRQPSCERREITLLLSALRRIGQKPPPGISVRAYTISTEGRATLGVRPVVERQLVYVDAP